MFLKIFIHVRFKRVEKLLRINLQLLGKKSTQKQLMKIKSPTIFHIFQFRIRRTQHKSPSFSKFTLQYHSILPRINLFEDTRRRSHGEPTITHDDYQLSPYNENDSRS